MSSPEITNTVIEALEDMKARDVVLIDVQPMTSITDLMVIASGTSDRHVRSVAENVIDKCKQKGQRPLGVEGLEGGEWVLVDLQDVLVHVMLPKVRDFYNLEKLWGSHQKAGVAAPAS